MNNPKSQALTGKDNNRMNKTTQTDNESTAAWAGTGHYTEDAGVSIPRDQAVQNAKEWVDNGSRL